jgi:type I restriction-modification system DNA methylase subunit
MADEQLGFDLGAADIVLPKPPAIARPRPKSAAPAVEQPALVHVAQLPEPEPPPVQRRTVSEEIRRSAQELARIVDKVTARGHNHHQVLDDFLDLSCSALLADDETHERVRRAYSREELDLISRGLGVVLIEASYGYHDIIGPAYEELGSRHRRAGLGQFFTPWDVALMMAEMVLGDPQPKPDGTPITILDPACGAGVMLLAAADVIERQAPAMLAHGQVALYGQDLDPTCCKMARLNLLSHGLMQQAQVVAAMVSAPDRARREVEQSGAAS